jgi:hypothetical protein
MLDAQIPDSFSGFGCQGRSSLRSGLYLCDSDTVVNIALYAILNIASRTEKGVLTAVKAETCARPNLGTVRRWLPAQSWRYCK